MEVEDGHEASDWNRISDTADKGTIRTKASRRSAQREGGGGDERGR